MLHHQTLITDAANPMCKPIDYEAHTWTIRFPISPKIYFNVTANPWGFNSCGVITMAICPECWLRTFDWWWCWAELSWYSPPSTFFLFIEVISINIELLYGMVSKLHQQKFHEGVLTHWGRVTHICVSDLTIIGSDNGLSPGRRQAIIRTNAGILLIRPLGTNFSEILIAILIVIWGNSPHKGQWRGALMFSLICV